MKNSLQFALITALAILLISMIVGISWSGAESPQAAQPGHASVAGPVADDDAVRTLAYYQIPALKLVNQDGVEVLLPEVLDVEKFVVVDFIFTTCATICPVLSSGLVNFQKQLGDDADKVRVVSITIDPEHDTPAVLREYSDRYRIDLDRQFLTGSREDINRAMKAFDAFMPNKMTHYPLTFMRGPGSDTWVRVMGLMSTAGLMAEYNALTNI